MLIDNYTQPGDWILDPFCGSGTLLVEASTSDRNSIGTDFDHVAAFVSRAKTARLHLQDLKDQCHLLLSHVNKTRRPESAYEELKWDDLPAKEVERMTTRQDLWIPQIPNIRHWFRNYVTIDLASILSCINDMRVPPPHKNLMRLCLASIIRACSNADPVPVSGLEVTSFMREKDRKGRLINPHHLFERKVHAVLEAAADYASHRSVDIAVETQHCDATRLASHIDRTVDCVITSPPYQTADDYYRRHQLEMYWLGFVTSQHEREKLIPSYIGRPTVRRTHPLLRECPRMGPQTEEWIDILTRHSISRVNAFKHYVVAMHRVFEQLRQVVKSDGRIVVVIGNNSVRGRTIPTVDLLPEIASPNYVLVDQMCYPIKDKYMSYSRRNGANIDTEYVLVFERSDCRAPRQQTRRQVSPTRVADDYKETVF